MAGPPDPLTGQAPDWLQAYLVVVGVWIAALQGRKLPALRPPLPPADLVIQHEYYLWMAVLLGAALVTFGLALTNESVFGLSPAFRYSTAQRRGLLACALALASPAIVTLVGPLADFSDPYLFVWFLSYSLAFCGLAGSAGVVLWRFGETTLADPLPDGM
ncbi:hypothetical protein OB920_06325 [Halobacteria archaeon HArc-gm2]|nr:hypothetical protein [Halobacteria archaeon HArc-gm2]